MLTALQVMSAEKEESPCSLWLRTTKKVSITHMYSMSDSVVCLHNVAHI